MSESLSAGTVFLNKYKVLGKVAVGSLGDDVYQGESVKTRNAVFIRILPTSITNEKELLERFFQEIKFTTLIQHPNILRTIEAGKEGSCHYMVTAAAAGDYLSGYLRKKGALGEKTAFSIALKIADGLDYAWKLKKILHRNICPETIIINVKGEPILMDFGLAKSLSKRSKSLTVAGFTVGDPRYMSPEQVVAKEDIDFHADMYSLGMLLYHMLTGKAPFSKKSPQELMDCHLSSEPMPLEDVAPDISENARAVLERMIKKSIEERYPDWVSVIRDMKAVLNEEPLFDPERSGKHNITRFAPREQKSKTPIVVISVIISLAVITAIIVLVLFWPDKEKTGNQPVSNTKYKLKKSMGELK